MARPRSQRIDYFPHDCKPDENLLIIEQRFGNDGYTFWYKLREMLGAAAGHSIDYNDQQSSDTLQVRTRLSAEKCVEILDLMAKSWAIDRELWQTRRIIWMQEFVDDLIEIYRKRKTAVPERPSFRRENGVSAPETAGNPGTDQFPRRKLPETPGLEGFSDIEERREEKRREEKTKDFACESISGQSDPPRTADPSGLITDRAMTCIERHNWDTLCGIYPKPLGLIEGGAEAEEIFFADPAKWPTWIRNAGHYAAAKKGSRYVHALDNWLRVAYRDYGEPPMPLGENGKPPPQELAEKLQTEQYKPPLSPEAEALFQQHNIPWPDLRMKVKAGEVKV